MLGKYPMTRQALPLSLPEGAAVTRAEAAAVFTPRRCLRRDMAAAYASVSPTKFDAMVKDGRMPRPFRIDGCVLWDVRQLDLAIDALMDQDDGATGWGL
jgi:predicted DNA-binding transcriptional regulator AlpA